MALVALGVAGLVHAIDGSSALSFASGAAVSSLVASVFGVRRMYAAPPVGAAAAEDASAARVPSDRADTAEHVAGRTER